MRLIEDREKARQIGDAAQYFVRTEYSIAKAMERVQDTYLGMMRK